MARKNYYNDDPGLSDVPLSSEEVAALLAEPGAVGKRDIPHLLRRVLATAQRCESVRRNYDDELRRRTAAMPRSGTPSTLSPEEAVKFLSQEQITRLFDRFSQEKLVALDALRERAEEDRQRTGRAVREALEAITLLLASGIPEPLRRKLEETLVRLRDLNGTEGA